MKMQLIRLSIAIFVVSCVFSGSVMAAGQIPLSGIQDVFSGATPKSVSTVSLYAPCALEKNTVIPVSTLISSENGFPVQGVGVIITGSDTKSVLATGITDKNGQFSTDLVLPGDMQEITLVAQTDIPGTPVLSDPVSVYFY